MYTQDGRQAPFSGWTGLWLFLPIIGAFVWFIKIQGALNRYWESEEHRLAPDRTSRASPKRGQSVRGRATGVVLPALVVLGLVARRRDRVDGLDAERLGRDAPAVRVAARHVLHASGSSRVVRRGRAPALRAHAEARRSRARRRRGRIPALRSALDARVFWGSSPRSRTGASATGSLPRRPKRKATSPFRARAPVPTTPDREQLAAVRAERLVASDRVVVAGLVLAAIVAYVVSERRAQPRQTLGRGPRRAARARARRDARRPAGGGRPAPRDHRGLRPARARARRERRRTPRCGDLRRVPAPRPRRPRARPASRRAPDGAVHAG